MDQQKPRPGGTRPDAKPTDDQGKIDIEALTAAVERLLRRDLEIGRERLRPGLRR